MSILQARILLALSLVIFITGAVAFEYHDRLVQPTGRLVYAAMVVTLLAYVLAVKLLAPERADGSVDLPANAMVGFLFGLLGVPFFVFSALVFANAWLDPSPRTPTELRIVDRSFTSDADGDWSYDASLADPRDPNEVLRLHIGDPDFPSTSAGTLRVGVCEGALGTRWFCEMP